MKTLRKILALALAVMMVMSLAANVFAAENNSITVTSAVKGETYKLYKLFDLSVDSETDPSAYSYTVNADWADFFAEGGAGAQYITVNESGYVTAISDAAALAKAAADWEGKPDSAQTIEASGETVVFSNLENGYWLITSTLGTLAMTETTPDKDQVTINEKNPKDIIEKKVQEDSTGEFGGENDAQVGDTVYFQSTITLQPHTRNVKVYDTMDSGLTYNEGSIAIEGLTKGVDYTVEEKPEGYTFVITFADAYIESLTATTTLILTYDAVLNENAVVKGEDGVAIVDQNNKTQITYGDKQSVDSTTKTTTHKFSVFKHAADSEDNLAGAVFSLKKAGEVVKLIKLDNNNYRVAVEDEEGAVDTFTTVADGDIVIWGVDADDYTLAETQAPAGYNLLTEEVAVTVDAGNATRIDVLNQAGTELPSTGGMGTTLFYALGGILVLAAVVLLVTKRRMSMTE